jgi:hypothetical protein
MKFTTTTEDVQMIDRLASRKGGRPRAVTPALRARLIELIARGLPFKHAARGAGISFQTMQNFRKANPDFEDELEQAVAAAIEKHLRTIETAAQTDPRYAAWMLEHRWPEHFSKSRIEISGPDGAPLAATVAFYLPKKQDGTPAAVTVTSTKTVKEIEDAN